MEGLPEQKLSRTRELLEFQREVLRWAAQAVGSTPRRGCQERQSDEGVFFSDCYEKTCISPTFLDLYDIARSGLPSKFIFYLFYFLSIRQFIHHYF